MTFEVMFPYKSKNSVKRFCKTKTGDIPLTKREAGTQSN